jgi:hypothetical protein
MRIGCVHVSVDVDIHSYRTSRSKLLESRCVSKEHFFEFYYSSILIEPLLCDSRVTILEIFVNRNLYEFQSR